MTDLEEPVVVYEAWNSMQAQFLCQLLGGEGIEARVASSADEMVRGVLPYQVSTCPVLVHRNDLERAQAIVAKYDHRLKDRAEGHPDTTEPFCYHCGEQVKENQSPCPACGHELDWSRQGE